MFNFKTTLSPNTEIINFTVRQKTMLPQWWSPEIQLSNTEEEEKDKKNPVTV